MATEALTTPSDEAILTSESKPTITIDRDSENVEPTRPQVNGDAASTGTDELDNKRISDIVDDLVNSTEVSISGGSDNEASKSDAAKLKDSERGHGRTSSSVKKPASFKPINVNKTFLTTKASTPSASSKTTDKAVPEAGSTSVPITPAQNARPRLVQKTASGLVAKASGANGGRPGAAPDGNAVWNKNRPVPPPEPKKYTDEELQNDRRIHIAQRLDPEQIKGQSWADQDDDGEDWAVDSITWKDGTKIVIPHTEEQAPQGTEPAVPPLVQENGVPEKPRTPAPGAPSPSVKPGVLASGRGLVLKGAPEKPTLVAKPPAPPTPVKSPWAPLPKIDKTSPAAMDPSAPSQPGPRPGEKGMPGQKTLTLPLPKEIAADDFSRNTWRDGPGASNRELFNSQSGRYEPVTDRRGPVRSEPAHGRQPALLQRSSQDFQGPAEPSAAFQTHRTSEQHGQYGRRRGSSNVSGGSGSFLHRLKPHDYHPSPDASQGRPDSVNGLHDPASPVSVPSVTQPVVHQENQQGQHQVPPNTSEAQAQVQVQVQGNVAGGDGKPAMSEQEFKEAQRQFMVRAREAARQRRLEEEAREEAAKKERIRLKLEALGPAPESKSAKKAASKEQASQSQQRETASPPRAATASLDAEYLSIASKNDRKPSITDDKKPAAHDGNDDQKPSLPSDKVASGQSRKMRETSPAHSSSSRPDKKSDVGSNGAAGIPSQETDEARTQPQGGTHAHPWPNEPKQTERYQQASWGSQATKNVWAPPNNTNRSLGNGTFGSDIGASQSSRNGSTKPGPGPIAPPSSARAGQNPQTNPCPTRQEPIGPPKPASRQERMLSKDLPASEVRDQRHNAWASAVVDSDAAFVDMMNSQFEDRDRRLKAEGRTLRDIQPSFKDTWRPTRLDTDGRRVEETPIRVQQGKTNSWNSNDPGAKSPDEQGQIITRLPQARQDPQKNVRNDSVPASKLSAGGSVAQQSRGSRFFPAKDTRQDMQRPKSPSPPPPDMAGHPAFDGDTSHPQVTLPGPRPVVRLPPSLESTPEMSKKSISQGLGWGTQAANEDNGHALPASLAPIGSQRAASTHAHHVQETTWQARIDNLLGGARKSLPPQRPLTVDERSFSSQPMLTGTPASSRDFSITSKGLAEECFEEQEMGSLPPIRLPIKVPELLWNPAPAPRFPLAKKLWVIGTSIEGFTSQDMGASNAVRIALPGQSEPKTLSVPFSRTRSNPRRDGRGGRGGNSRHVSQSHRAGKGRDEQGSGNSGSNPAPRSGRASFRGRERDNWGRNNSAPIQSSG